MKKLFFFVLGCLGLVNSVWADKYPVNSKVKITHYAFNLTFSDKTDRIEGSAAITVIFTESGNIPFRLDLVNQDPVTGKGMRVLGVTLSGNPVAFTHENSALVITPGIAYTAGTSVIYTIQYSGIPIDGLHIGAAKYGDRSFFSDNWPNKARNWLPVIDHPSNKATCEFLIKAPQHYQVVSNGLLLEQSNIDSVNRLTHWKQSVPISTWLYTIGVADFAVQYVDTFQGKSLQSWVYAKDRVAGFNDLSYPVKATMEFFSAYIGPYAYEKVASIESPVVGGGMEAASAIGYSDKLITGTRSDRTRNVVIHELAHQWFGNAVTENNWDNAWLSEAFATCFTTIFLEHAYGKAAYDGELVKAKKLFKDFYSKNPNFPIVANRTAEETDVTNYAVTYQKGSYVLLMLRDMIGKAAFQKGIRAYYASHMNGHATTEDFITAMEKASGKNLAVFFQQWLKRGDYIQAKASWQYDTIKKQLVITLIQQPSPTGVYQFPLEWNVFQQPGTKPVLVKTIITKGTETIVIPMKSIPVKVEADPRRVLLADIEVKQAQ